MAQTFLLRCAQLVSHWLLGQAPTPCPQRFSQVFAEELDGLGHKFGFRLTAWGLMPDHFHLWMQPRGADLEGKVGAIQRLDTILAIARKGA